MALGQINWRNWNENPTYSNNSAWESKMYSFAGPKNKFNVSQLIVVGKGTASKLIVFYRTGIESPTSGGTYKLFGETNFGTAVDTKTIDPAISSDLKGIDTIQFLFRFNTLTATTLAIDDIYIVYRTYRELSINED